jgi:hypothetical protein
MIGKIATLASDTNTHRSTLQARRGAGAGTGTGTGAGALFQQAPGRRQGALFRLSPRRLCRCCHLHAHPKVEVHRLVWFVGILAFSMGILLFVIGVARKMNPLGGAPGAAAAPLIPFACAKACERLGVP